MAASTRCVWLHLNFLHCTNATISLVASMPSTPLLSAQIKPAPSTSTFWWSAQAHTQLLAACCSRHGTSQHRAHHAPLREMERRLSAAPPKERSSALAALMLRSLPAPAAAGGASVESTRIDFVALHAHTQTHTQAGEKGVRPGPAAVVCCGLPCSALAQAWRLQPTAHGASVQLHPCLADRHQRVSPSNPKRARAAVHCQRHWNGMLAGAPRCTALQPALPSCSDAHSRQLTAAP